MLLGEGCCGRGRGAGGLGTWLLLLPAIVPSVRCSQGRVPARASLSILLPDPNRRGVLEQLLDVVAPRREFVAEAYARARDVIVHGELGPGSRLLETELAERPRMSRAPLRRALYLLAPEGYLESSGEGRQSRLSVVAPTREDSTEIFNTVGKIDALAAERAAALPPDETDEARDRVPKPEFGDADDRGVPSAQPLRHSRVRWRVPSRDHAERRGPAAVEPPPVDGAGGRPCINLYYSASGGRDPRIGRRARRHHRGEPRGRPGIDAARRESLLAPRRAARRFAKTMTALGDRGIW
ncbi:MAG: GntR family transcriptional regulator [Gemmatimonadetes bacterium]|jgi:hypothetical protein|nr:GntR family transcriptional regulator [Gemmatimonadota bacterium]